MKRVAGLLVAAVLVCGVVALDNGLALTPPMGFNTWNQFLCDIDEGIIRRITDAVVKTGLREVGYKYINIDDCWMTNARDAQGRLVPDPIRFPSGIRALADYVHSQGLYLGIYEDAGVYTCQGLPGSLGYYEIDAQTFANWTIDFLKFDFCFATDEQLADPAKYYTQMSKALNATGRPIVFSACNWGYGNPHEWAPEIANLWRTTGDISPAWSRVVEIIDENAVLYSYAKTGAWNDPDMLEVGVTGRYNNRPGTPETSLTPRESQSHFSMWAMFASPLLIGADISSAPQWVIDILSNTEVVAVDQDKLGIQAQRVKSTKRGIGRVGYGCVDVGEGCTHTEVWKKPLVNDRVAVFFLNRAAFELENSPQFSNETISVSLNELGLDDTRRYTVRDVVAKKDLGTLVTSSLSVAEVPQHGSALYVLTPM